MKGLLLICTVMLLLSILSAERATSEAILQSFAILLVVLAIVYIFDLRIFRRRRS